MDNHLVPWPALYRTENDEALVYATHSILNRGENRAHLQLLVYVSLDYFQYELKKNTSSSKLGGCTYRQFSACTTPAYHQCASVF